MPCPFNSWVYLSRYEIERPILLFVPILHAIYKPFISPVSFLPLSSLSQIDIRSCHVQVAAIVERNEGQSCIAGNI